MRQEKSIDQISYEFNAQHELLKGKKARECQLRSKKMSDKTRAASKLLKENKYV